MYYCLSLVVRKQENYLNEKNIFTNEEFTYPKLIICCISGLKTSLLANISGACERIV